MSIIGSDGLSLSISDGGSPEQFASLRGTSVSRFEITQRVVDSPALKTDFWNVGVTVAERRTVIECTALATDEPAALRVRSLAMSGSAGTIRLAVTLLQTIQCAVYVTQYRETMESGEIKRLYCRLESTGAVTVL